MLSPTRCRCCSSPYQLHPTILWNYELHEYETYFAVSTSFPLFMQFDLHQGSSEPAKTPITSTALHTTFSTPISLHHNLPINSKHWYTHTLLSMLFYNNSWRQINSLTFLIFVTDLGNLWPQLAPNKTTKTVLYILQGHQLAEVSDLDNDLDDPLTSISSALSLRGPGWF